MKKGDLSINIIVIAAIAMIILVVVSVLVFRSGGILDSSRTCAAVGGDCVPRYLYDSCADYADSELLSETLIQHRTAVCPDPQEQFCCVRLR
jgi:hypothetical protein